jgi:DNA repair protein RadC
MPRRQNRSDGVAEAIGLFAPSPAAPSPAAPSSAASIALNAAHGHRERMRLRLLQAGPDALLDHEMLEMILFIALPRRDTKPIARALLARFRDFPGVIAAPPNELRDVDGLSEAGMAALKLVQAAALRLMQKTLLDRPILNDWQKLIDYLTAALGRERIEQFRVLFLDPSNCPGNRCRLTPTAVP